MSLFYPQTTTILHSLFGFDGNLTTTRNVSLNSVIKLMNVTLGIFVHFRDFWYKIKITRMHNWKLESACPLISVTETAYCIFRPNCILWGCAKDCQLKNTFVYKNRFQEPREFNRTEHFFTAAGPYHYHTCPTPLTFYSSNICCMFIFVECRYNCAMIP
jgi:hypothetical protein